MSTATSRDSLDDALLAAVADLYAKGREWVIRLAIVRHDRVQDVLEARGLREHAAVQRLARLVESGLVEQDWVLGRYRLATVPVVT